METAGLGSILTTSEQLLQLLKEADELGSQSSNVIRPFLGARRHSLDMRSSPHGMVSMPSSRARSEARNRQRRLQGSVRFSLHQGNG